MRPVLAAVLAAAVPPLAAQSTPPSLAPPVTWELAGEQPKDAAVADFDGDGHLDVAVAGSAGAEVAFRFGDGTGAFPGDGDVHVVLGVYDPGPWGIDAADFDGDGDADFAVTLGASYDGLGRPNHKVNVFLNDGSGGFAYATTLETVGLFPIDCAAADYDRDGRVDLAVICNRGGIDVFPGLGDGSFGPRVPLRTGSSLFAGIALRAADIDGDGHVDLLATFSTYATSTLFWGDGTAQFDGARSTTAAPGVSVCIDDVDRDGDLDLAMVAADRFPNYVGGLRVLRNDGGRSFHLLGPFGQPGTGAIAPGDVNGDGIPDVVSLFAAGVRVFRGIGDGRYVEHVLGGSLGIEPSTLSVADWNGDGLTDLASACRNLGQTPYLAVRLADTVPGPWRHLGHGSGAAVVPLLRGEGALTPAAPVTLDVRAAAARAPAVLVLGAARLDLPLLGGVLVPRPDLVGVGLITDAQGALVWSSTWPDGAPPGFELLAQLWLADAAAPAGVAATNGLRGRTP